MTRTKLASVCFVAARNWMRQHVLDHADAASPPGCGRSQSTTTCESSYVLQSTTPVLLLYYKVLFQYYSVLQTNTPLLLCTTKYYSITTLYYKVQSTIPVLLCTTKYYSSTTLYYKVLLQYFSVLQNIVRLRKTGDAAEHKIWTWVLV